MSVNAPQESPHYVRLYPEFEDEEKGVSQATPSRSLQLNGRIQVNLERPEEVETAYREYMRFQDLISDDPCKYFCCVPAVVTVPIAVFAGKIWIAIAGGGVGLLGLCACGIYGSRQINKISYIAEALIELKNSDSQFANDLREKGVAQVSEEELIQLHREWQERDAAGLNS